MFDDVSPQGDWPQPLPSYLQGLLGTRPKFDVGPLWDTYTDYILQRNLSDTRLDSLLSVRPHFISQMGKHCVITFDGVIVGSFVK